MAFKILLSIVCLLCYFICLGQTKVLKEHTFHIESISPFDDDYSDLQPLKERIGNAQVVMLGEQTHGDGATFEAKARIVRFLHQEMGFNVLAFEGEMFGLMKAKEAIENGEDSYNAFKQSIYWAWSDAEEFRPVMDYIAENIHSKNPLSPMGFDVQNGSEYMVEKFIPELNDFLNKSINANYKEEFFIPLEILISEFNGGDFKNYTSDDSLLFFKTYKEVQKKLSKAALKPEFKTQAIIWERLLNNLLLDLKSWLEFKNGITEIVQNSRDKAMAENLLFLKRLYPDKKIICWGASFHFAKSWNTIETENETTQSYLEKITIDQRSPEYNMDEMSKAVAMGELVANSLGNDLYSLAFTSYMGNYAYDTIRQVYPTPETSVEFDLFNQGFKYAFVDLSKADIPENEKMFFASPEGYIPIKADWKKMFDGIFFIREMYPTTILKPGSDTANQKYSPALTNKTTTVIGKISNKKNKQPVSYVNIGLKGKSIGTASNEDGRFELKIPQANHNEIIQFSAIGYERKEMTLEKAASGEVLNIELKPSVYSLAEYTVEAKALSPKQIVKKAIKNIRYNYPQNPYNLDLYYRSNHMLGDTVHCTQEAALELYDAEGFRKSTWRKLIKNKNIRLNHYRSTNDKLKLYPHDLWIYWSHDYILTRDNPFSFHGIMGYYYKLEEIIPFEDSYVYKIFFNCTKKINYFTGFGSPDSLSGFLYINQKDHALVKYEYHLEFSRQSRNDDSTRRIDDVTHSYRNFNGIYFHDFIKAITLIGGKNKTSADWSWTELQKIVLTTEINVESPKIINEKMSEFNTDICYDKEFWDNFNLIPER